MIPRMYLACICMIVLFMLSFVFHDNSPVLFVLFVAEVVLLLTLIREVEKFYQGI